MSEELYILQVNYLYRFYGYMWLERAMKLKWQIVAKGQ